MVWDSVPLAGLYFHSCFGGHSHLHYSSAHCHLSSGGVRHGNQCGRLDHPLSHLLFRWEPPARVFEPLEVLKLDSDVLYIKLEQVPEACQVLRGGLGVGWWVLNVQADVTCHEYRRTCKSESYILKWWFAAVSDSGSGNIVQHVCYHDTHHTLLAEAEKLLYFLRHEHLGAANCITDQLKD